MSGDGVAGFVSVLRHDQEAILQQWIAANRDRTGAGRLSPDVLRDHLPALLDRLVDSLTEPRAGAETGGTARSYAFDRLARAVDLADCLRELEQLRGLLTRLWWAHHAEQADPEGVLFRMTGALDRLTRDMADAYAGAQRNILEALDRIATSALEDLPLERLLHRLLSITVDAVETIDTAAVFLVEGDRLRLRAVDGLREDEVNILSLAIGEGFAGQVAAQRAPMSTGSAAQDPRVKSRAIREKGIRGLHGLPLLSGGELLGVVTVGSLSEAEFSKLTQQLLRALAERAADVIAFDLKRRQRELGHRELEALLESIGDAILFVDVNGKVMRANPVCIDLLGFDPRGASGAEIASRILPRLPGGQPMRPDEMPSARAMTRRRRVTVRVEMADAHGQNRLLSGSASPVMVDGEPRGAVVLWHDLTGQDRLIRRLDEQRRLLDAVIREVPMGIAILTGEDLTFRVANRAYLEFMPEPFRTQGIEGLRFDGCAPNASRSGVYAIVRQVQQTRQPYVNREYQVDKSSRGVTWWRGAIVPIESGRSTPDIAIVAMDVTDEVRERRALEEQRSRLDAILSTMPVGIILADATGKLVEANDNARAIWGGALPMVGLNELGVYRGWWAKTGKPLAPEDWALARALRSGEVSVGELIDIQRFDGSRGSMLNSAAPVMGPDGKLAGAVVVLLDATEQRRAAQALENQTAELNAILDALADGMVVYDREGRITRMNSVARDVLGYSAEQASSVLERRTAGLRMTRADGKLVPPEETPIARALRGEVVKGEVLRLASRDDRFCWVAISSAPIRLPSGELNGAVTTFVDVTKLREMREQMEDFVRMLSHDIRTPLGTVSMQAQILLRIPDVDEATQRRARTILNAASQMDGMIRDLVDASRLETGRVKVECRPCDVRAYLADLEVRLAGVLDTQRIRTTVPERLPLIQADPERLDRILVNLLSNALKYSPPSKEIFLTAQPVPDGVAISVRDQGQGIAPEELPHVFERYFRAKRAAHGKVEGLGLGLYITRLLVQAHEGRISVESEVEKGSTFTVVLPAVPKTH